MRLESDGKSRLSVGPAHLQGGGDDRAVAEMDAIEIAHGDDSPPRDRVVGGGISDNGKTSCHCRGSWRVSWQEFFGDWGLSPPNRDAAAASKSSGQGLSQNESNRQFRFNALFNACCYWWGEDCGSRRPVGSLWRKR
jgi:hypothetical protein